MIHTASAILHHPSIQQKTTCFTTAKSVNRRGAVCLPGDLVRQQPDTIKNLTDYFAFHRSNAAVRVSKAG